VSRYTSSHLSLASRRPIPSPMCPKEAGRIPTPFRPPRLHFLSCPMTSPSDMRKLTELRPPHGLHQCPRLWRLARMCRAASTTGEVDHCCLRNVSFVSMHEERGQFLRCSEHKAKFRTAVDRHARTWQVCGISDCRQGKRDRGSGYACWVSCNEARGLVLIVQRPQSVEPDGCRPGCVRMAWLELQVPR
jgi:hypothetical protein